jgi:hypothetical protein
MTQEEFNKINTMKTIFAHDNFTVITELDHIPTVGDEIMHSALAKHAKNPRFFGFIVKKRMWNFATNEVTLILEEQ